MDSWKDGIPSNKFLDVLSLFNNKFVLDYGCGNGWASIALSKLGALEIDSVDVSKNVVNVLDFYKEIYNINNINCFAIDSNWLSLQESNHYEGFFSSNVIDVIPLDMSKEIIKEASRIVKDNSYVVFSLNYYVDVEIMAKKGCQVKGNQIYIDGILRLTSLTDEEWSKIFRQYFKEINLIYFSWPSEKEEKRRLFILRK